MKKEIIHLGFILIIVIMNGCNTEYEPILSESPDDRVGGQIEHYEATLMDAPFGWKTFIHTGSGAGYFYHFDFQDNGNVIMLSDFNETTAGEFMESTWTIKGLQRPTLSFTTYSYIHLPADPDGDVNNGIPGDGLLSDFEFAFTRITDDSIFLKGIQHGTEAVMTRATESEHLGYRNGEMQQMIRNTQNYLASGNSYLLTLPNDLIVPIAISVSRKLLSVQHLDTDGETIRATSASFVFTLEGIQPREELSIGGYVMKKLVWNSEDNAYAAVFDSPVLLERSMDPFIFSPATPLYSKLGKNIITTIIPHHALGAPLVGHSESFTEAYRYAASEMLAGPYRVTLDEIKFSFIPNTDRMVMTLGLIQPVQGGGAARFEAKYTYSYTVRDGGIVKFKLETFDDNAGLMFEYMIGIFNHFDNDTFKMEYLGGDFSLLAGFFSQEDPLYYFSGYVFGPGIAN